MAKSRILKLGRKYHSAAAFLSGHVKKKPTGRNTGDTARPYENLGLLNPLPIDYAFAACVSLFSSESLFFSSRVARFRMIFFFLSRPARALSPFLADIISSSLNSELAAGLQKMCPGYFMIIQNARGEYYNGILYMLMR